MATEMQENKNTLQDIKKELHQLRSTMRDNEMFLTTEESELLHDSHENEAEGKLVSSADLHAAFEE